MKGCERHNEETKVLSDTKGEGNEKGRGKCR